MSKQAKTEQESFWQSDFGEDYLERNKYDVGDLDKFYLETWGISRTDLNSEFIEELKTARILEVGCNVGNQLRLLHHSGYQNLFGIEISPFAAQAARLWNPTLNILQGSAFDLPFRDQYFDLVFTSGVLIHISPQDVGKAMDEMYRVSKKYIWGFEYYSEELKEINYRGHDNRLWKRDFCQLFLDRYPDLERVKEKKVPYVADSNVDQMYLLRKKD